MATMREAVEKGFRLIGLMFRDFDARLKALEIRTASLYPNSDIGGSATKMIPDYFVKRQDGTLAYAAICSNTYAINNGSQNGTFRNIVNKVEVTIYGLDGVTVVKKFTYSPTTAYNKPIDALVAS